MKATTTWNRVGLWALAWFAAVMLIGCANSHEVAAAKPQSEDSWTVLFRSADPRYWGLRADHAQAYAAPLNEVPADTRYVRLRRMDTGEYVIIAVGARDLGADVEDGSYGWVGDQVQFGHGRRGPGIINKAWHSQTRGDPAIAVDSGQSIAGWGFSTAGWVDDRQTYVWDGKHIAPTVMEIAVSGGNLTAQERAHLVPPVAGMTASQAAAQP